MNLWHHPHRFEWTRATDGKFGTCAKAEGLRLSAIVCASFPFLKREQKKKENKKTHLIRFHDPPTTAMI